MKNYLGFIRQVRESRKPVLKQLYSLASKDVRTVTGSNLRNILLLTNQSSIDDLQPRIVEAIEYKKMQKEDEWRVGLVKEVINLIHGEMTTLEGWTSEELNVILNAACTQ